MLCSSFGEQNSTDWTVHHSSNLNIVENIDTLYADWSKTNSTKYFQLKNVLFHSPQAPDITSLTGLSVLFFELARTSRNIKKLLCVHFFGLNKEQLATMWVPLMDNFSKLCHLKILKNSLVNFDNCKPLFYSSSEISA